MHTSVQPDNADNFQKINTDHLIDETNLISLLAPVWWPHFSGPRLVAPVWWPQLGGPSLAALVRWPQFGGPSLVSPCFAAACSIIGLLSVQGKPPNGLKIG